MPNSSLRYGAVAASLLMVGIFVWQKQHGQVTTKHGSHQISPAARTAPYSTGALRPLPEGIRRDGQGLAENTNPDAPFDLDVIAGVLENYLLFVKGANGRFPSAGSNADLMHALFGANPDRIELVSPDHPNINAGGELVDRWETPLFFHFNSSSCIEIRSAGADRKLWSSDDITQMVGTPDNGTFDISGGDDFAY